MPINLSDEALEEFDKLPEHEKSFVIDDMSDEDASLFADAFPKWREQKQAKQFVAGQIQGFESPTAQMSIGSATPQRTPVQSNPYVGAGAQNPYTVKPGEIQQTKEQVIDPVIRKFQQGPGTKVAQKIVNAYSGAQDIQDKINDLLGIPKLTPEERAATEFLGYEALTWLGGEDLVNRQLSEAQQLKGVNNLTDSFGTEGAAFVQGLAHYGGQAPLFLIGGGQGAKAGLEAANTIIKGAPQLSKLTQALLRTGGTAVGSAAEGTVTGTIEALFTPGAKLQDGAIFGALGGATVGGGAHATSEAAPVVIKAAKDKLKMLAVTSRLATSEIADEVERLAFSKFNEPSPAIRASGEKPLMKQPPPVNAFTEVVDIKDKSFKPGWFNVVVGPDDKLYSVFTEMRKGSPVLKQATVPLHSIDDAIEHGKWVAKHKVDGMASTSALAHPELKSEIWRLAAPIDVDEAARIRLMEDLGQMERALEPTNIQRKGNKRIPQDSSVYGWDSRPSAVLETPDGRMEIRRLPPPKEPTAPISPGDDVQIPAPGGTVRARVKDVRGPTVVIDVPGAKQAIEVDQAQVLQAGPELPLAANSDISASKKVTQELPQTNPGNMPMVGGGAGVPPVSQKSVYAGRGVEDSLQRGTLMGQDKANPNNVQVRLHNGEIVSLPKGDVFKLKIPKDLAPGPVPSNGQPLDLATVSEPWAEELQMVHDLVNYGQGKPGVMEMLDKQLMNPAIYQYVHGTMDAANALALQQAMKNVDARDEVFKVFKQQFKDKSIFGSFAKDVNAVGSGKMSLDQLWEKYPESSNNGRQFVVSLLKEIDDNDRAIQALGGVPQKFSELLDNGELDKYLSKMYRAHWMGPDEWLKVAPPKVLDDAIRALHKEFPEKFPQEISNEIAEILRMGNTPDMREKMFVNLPIGAKWRNPQARKNIPKEIKALLGEEDSGFIRLSHLVGNQRLVKHNLTMWKDIANSPEIWSPGPQVTEAGRWIKLDNNRELYGAAAGGYVSPELKPILDAGKTIQKADSILRSVAGWRKGNLTTFGGATQWLNNARRNLKNMTLAGGLDVFHPIESGRSFLDAVQQLASWKKLPVNAQGEHPLTMWRRLGVDTGGFASNEMGRVSEIRKALEKELSNMKEGASLWDVFEKARDVVTKFVTNQSSVHDALKAGYDYIDRVMKIASANQITKRLMAKGMPFEDAAREAAWRVRASFPDFSNVGPIAEKMRDNIGIAAPFVSAHVENLRINRMLPVMLQKDPSLKWRLVGTTAFLGALGLASSELRRQNGISDAEVQAAIDDKKLSKKFFRPGLAAQPWRDEKGRVVMHDASSWLDDFQLLNGAPSDPVYTRIMSNMVSGFFGGGMDPAIQKMFEDSGLLTAQPEHSYKPLEGEKGIGRVIKFIYDTGFGGPKIGGNLSEDLRRGGFIGQLGRSEEQLTPRQTVMRMMGISKGEPYTLPGDERISPSHRGAQSEKAQSFKEYKENMQRIGYRKLPKDVEARERALEEKKELRKAEREAFKKKRQQQMETSKTVKEAQEQRK